MGNSESVTKDNKAQQSEVTSEGVEKHHDESYVTKSNDLYDWIPLHVEPSQADLTAWFESDDHFSSKSLDKLLEETDIVYFRDYFNVATINAHGSFFPGRFIQIPKNSVVFTFQNQGKQVIDTQLNREICPTHQQTNYTYFVVKFLTNLRKKYPREHYVSVSDVRSHIKELEAMVEKFDRDVSERCWPKSNLLLVPYFEDDIVPDFIISLNSDANKNYLGIRSWNEYLGRARVSHGEYVLKKYKSQLKRWWQGLGQVFDLGEYLDGLQELKSAGLNIVILNSCLSTDSPGHLLGVKPDVDFLFRDIFHEFSLLSKSIPQEGNLQAQQNVGGKRKALTPIDLLKGEIKSNFIHLNTLSQNFFLEGAGNLELLERIDSFCRVFYSSFVLGYSGEIMNIRGKSYRKSCPKDSTFTMYREDFSTITDPLDGISDILLPIRDGFGKKIDWGYTRFSEIPTQNIPWKVPKSKPFRIDISSLQDPEFMYFLSSASKQSKLMKLILQDNRASYDISKVGGAVETLINREEREKVFRQWEMVMTHLYVDIEKYSSWEVYAMLQFKLFVDLARINDVPPRFSGADRDEVQKYTNVLDSAHIFQISSQKFIIYSRFIDLASLTSFETKIRSPSHGFYERNMSFPYISPLEFMVANYVLMDNGNCVPLGDVVLMEMRKRTAGDTEETIDAKFEKELEKMLPSNIEAVNLKDKVAIFIRDREYFTHRFHKKILSLLPPSFVAKHLPQEVAKYEATDLLEIYFPHADIVKFSQKYCVFDYVLFSEIGPLLANITEFKNSLKGKPYRFDDYQKYKVSDFFNLYFLNILRISNTDPGCSRAYKNVKTYNLSYLLCLEMTMMGRRGNSNEWVNSEHTRKILKHSASSV